MLETERLLIRRFRKSDVDTIFEMRSDPEVMRFISEPQTKRQSSVNWMEMISALLDSDGIGYCALEEKNTGDVAGWCGLWKLTETDEIEVGYAVAKSKWGLGYATEAAAEVVDYAFRELALDHVVAVAYPDNERSIGVMKKLGMSYVRHGEFYGKPLVQYSVTKEEWTETPVRKM